MATGMLVEMPGVTAEQYDSVMENLDWYAKDKPQGFVSHYAGPTANGWVVFDVWESQGDFERFMQERLGSALQAAFGEAPQMQPRFIPIHNQDHA